MARYHRALMVESSPQVQLAFTRLIADLRALEARSDPARRVGIRALIRQYQLLQVEYSERLDRIAVATAAQATKRIRARIDATRKRSPTGKKPGLKQAVVCRPYQPAGLRGVPLGWVGIADEDKLDALRNPYSPGYGPYWRAQEFGTGSPEVKSQVGRRIHGLFFGTGGTGPGERPASQYRGGGGPHPVFVSSKGQRSLYGDVGFSGGAGQRGGFGGAGEISVEIKGRHFIRDGANDARRDWLIAVRSNERRTVARISILRGLTAAEARARTRRVPRRR